MFKVGQDIVCINNMSGSDLVVGEVYTVDAVLNNVLGNYVHICNAHGDYEYYISNRFKLAEQVLTKEQIIHGNNQNVKNLGLKGITWILSKVEDSRYVGVQYSLCSSKDNYNRKTGVAVARQKPMQMVLKTKLPEFVLDLTCAEQCVSVNTSVIYQAVVRLD
jgi:hypothetical protein